MWHRVSSTVAWSPPTSAEFGSVAKAAVAAGLAWWLATLVTDAPSPVLAALTAVVVVQVSARSPIRSALERSVAVVLGVMLALIIGDALELNGVVVALLVAASLGIAELLLRLPSPAARQVPVSILAVLSTFTFAQEASGRQRMVDTLLGAGVGVAIAMALPVSRVREARQLFAHLGDGLRESLNAMADGLQQPWSTEQTEEWRRNARTVRDRVARDAIAAVDGGESIRWNVRDRPHRDLFQRLAAAMPRFQRAAIGVSVIARGLDDHARLSGTSHVAMPSMGRLFGDLADAIQSLSLVVLGEIGSDSLERSLDAVRTQRQRCGDGASRRAREAVAGVDGAPPDELEGEWLGYAALLVQVDRIVADLSGPLAT